MTPFDREALVAKMACSDAEFNGRPFEGLGRADKDRYLARSRAALSIAENAISRIDETDNRVVRAALAFTSCMAEFEDEPGACGEQLDGLHAACDAWRKIPDERSAIA